MCAVGQADVSIGPGGRGVTAGNSDLIGICDYTDTWTIGPTATVPARVGYAPQGFPLPAGVAVMENTHGNPSVSWSTTLGSIATDASNFPTGASPYPGSSGAGTATGFTQTGIGSEGNFTISYGLRNNFVVQFDTLQASDRVDLFLNNAGFGGGTGSVTGITDNVGLAVFFRDDNDGLPSIGVYNGITELDTGLTTGLVVGDEDDWHNYAVQFNLVDEELTFWVDEVLRGTFDYGTAFPLLNASNAFIGIGSSGGQDRLWTDNFQVGLAASAVPEPGAWLMWTVLGAVACVGVFQSRRKLSR
jgi:hypothetical protein